MEYFYSFNKYLKDLFGCRVQRIPLNANFTCPNRLDGKPGCIYCYQGSSYKEKSLDLKEQLEKGILFAKKKYKAKKFLAYFQAYTNTFDKVENLKKKYDVIKLFPDIVGLIIGTRPDCINEEILKLINSYTDDYLVWIEYGLQSPHFETLKWMNRGHYFSDFLKALFLTKLKFPKIKVCTHVILGFPGENKEKMLETAKILSNLPIDGIKIHPLHILKGTPLAKIYEEKKFPILSLEEYADIVTDFISYLPQNVVIQRVTGEAPEDLLIAPKWCSFKEKMKVINTINDFFKKKNLYQGKNYSGTKHLFDNIKIS